MQICPKCGSDNPDDRVACWNCFAQLRRPGAQPPVREEKRPKRGKREPVETPPLAAVAPPPIEEAPAARIAVEEPQVPAPPQIEPVEEPEPSAELEEPEPVEAPRAAFVLDEEEEALAVSDAAAGRTPFDLDVTEPETKPAPIEEVSEPEAFPYAGPISGLSEEEAAVEEPTPAPEPLVESEEEMVTALGAAEESPVEHLSVTDARKRARARLARQRGKRKGIPLLLVLFVLLVLAAVAVSWYLGIGPFQTI